MDDYVQSVAFFLVARIVFFLMKEAGFNEYTRRLCPKVRARELFDDFVSQTSRDDDDITLAELKERLEENVTLAEIKEQLENDTALTENEE